MIAKDASLLVEIKTVVGDAANVSVIHLKGFLHIGAADSHKKGIVR